MVFTKVEVYKARELGAYIVELLHDSGDSIASIHRSSALPRPEAVNFLRHLQVSDEQIGQWLENAENNQRQTAAAGA